MKKFLIASTFILLASAASATTTDCKKQGGGYMCGGNTYIDGSKAESAAEATAIAAQIQGQAQGQVQGQEQSQGQGQGQSQTSDNSNSSSISISDNDDSVSLATPAGGGCTWGVNLAIPGEGGFGVCGTTKNQTAAALAVIADEIGNPCAADNTLAVAALLKAPLLKGIKLSCH